MEKFSIQTSMHSEHLELERLANKALEGFEIDTKTQLKIFADYEKLLKSHMDREEKAVYAIKQSLDTQLQALLRQIFSEHQKMNAMLADIRHKIAKEEYQDANEFFSLIKNHHHLEEKSLYAVLDNNLDSEEKDQFKKEFSNIG